MKNIDYNKFSLEELEEMQRKIASQENTPEETPKISVKEKVHNDIVNAPAPGWMTDLISGELGLSEEQKLKKKTFREQQDKAQEEFRKSPTGKVFRHPARIVRATLGGAGDIADIARAGLTPLDIRGKIDQLTGNTLKPSNFIEKGIDTVVEVIPSLPIGGPAVKAGAIALTKAQKAAKFLQGLIAKQSITPVNVAGAGAASIAGKYMAEENPLDLENPIAKQAASLAASMGAGIIPHTAVPLAKSIKNIPSSAATKAAAFGDLDPAAVEHARESGIDILPADALKSKWAKRTQNGMASLPFIGGKIQKAMEKRYEQAIEGLGQSNPGTLSKEAGADLVLKGSEAKHAHHEQEFSKKYNDIGKKIASHERKAELAEAPIREKYVAAEEELASEIKRLESAKKTLILTPKQHSDLDGHLLELRKAATDSKQQLNNLSKEHLVDPKNALSYLEELRNKLKTKTMKAEFDASPIGQRRDKLISMAKENGGYVPYDDIVEFRRAVDSSVTSFGTHGEIPSGQRKKLSGLINQDVANHLQAIDPELKSAWKNTNREYSLYKDKVLPAINKVLKNEKNGTDLGGLMSVLPDPKNGGKALKNVLDHLPTTKEKQQLFDIVIRTAGTDNKGNFSMVKAYNYFNKLTPMTQNRLLTASGKSPQEIKKYKSTMETINNVWKTSQEENFSGSSKHFIQHSITASVMYNIGSGNWATAAAQIGALGLGTAATGTALKNNRLVNAMYNGYQKENMTKKEFYNWCGKVSKADPHFRDVINNVIKPSAINAAKSHVAKEITAGPVSYEAPELPQDVAPTQDAPIDYSQYSIEELEDMQHQISEGQ
jgi:hypothetical protein